MWRRDGTLLTASANAPLRPLRAGFADGFASVRLQGRELRVFGLSDRSGRYQVQVGNDRALIDADFQKHGVKAVSLAAVGMPLSGWMMWWSVRVALRPITSMQQAVAARAAFDLTPLPEHALPTEVAPMVRAFNGLLRQLDDAIQAERNFLSDAAHELRTPLSALQTQLDVALHAGSDEERQRGLHKAQLGVRRSSRLCEQLLDLARLEAGGRAPERRPCALQEVVLHTVDEYAMAATLGGRRLDADVEAVCVQGTRMNCRSCCATWWTTRCGIHRRARGCGCAVGSSARPRAARRSWKWPTMAPAFLTSSTCACSSGSSGSRVRRMRAAVASAWRWWRASPPNTAR
ncbi:MAG: Sensor protein QseC [Stenotrophomonas maltophilia]|uniref:histidine kinase n=1 Tax=Stenotrophomonas maltophilia TaxID=40324 RepID=A0A7V8FJ46_STEMA|nr:MAG: Sensor protein QseC [Stenotrophomonas maltophilia]